MHLALHLLAQTLRSSGDKFAHVRTQLSRGRVNDLKLFFDTYGEPVIHGRASGPKHGDFSPNHTRTLAELHEPVLGGRHGVRTWVKIEKSCSSYPSPACACVPGAIFPRFSCRLIARRDKPNPRKVRSASPFSATLTTRFGRAPSGIPNKQ